MGPRAFDAFVRRAEAALGRRASLKALGLATLATGIVAPSIASASKAAKKARRKCRKQREQCLESVNLHFCQNNAKRQPPGAGAEGTPCLDNFRTCCEHFATCQAGEGLDCILGRIAIN